jgi:hypothetical protein
MAPEIRRHTEKLLYLIGLTTECWHLFYLALQNSPNPAALPIPPMVVRSYLKAAQQRQTAMGTKCPVLMKFGREAEHPPQASLPIPLFPAACLSALGCEE